MSKTSPSRDAAWFAEETPSGPKGFPLVTAHEARSAVATQCRALFIAAGGYGGCVPTAAPTFEAAAPNECWVADLAYVPTLGEVLYLAVVLHAGDRGDPKQALDPTGAR